MDGNQEVSVGGKGEVMPFHVFYREVTDNLKSDPHQRIGAAYLARRYRISHQLSCIILEKMLREGIVSKKRKRGGDYYMLGESR